MMTSQEGPERPVPDTELFSVWAGSVPAELFSFPRQSGSQLISGVPGSSDGS